MLNAKLTHDGGREVYVSPSGAYTTSKVLTAGWFVKEVATGKLMAKKAYLNEAVAFMTLCESEALGE